MNILVAVDLSEASSKVIEAARGVAHLSGAVVHILYVADPDPDFAGLETGPEVIRKQVEKMYRRERRDVEEMASRLRDEGLDANAFLSLGPAVATTLKEADRLNAGLIVVGSHGHSAVYDVLIGSFSAGIMRKSKLPILVVPVQG